MASTAAQLRRFNGIGDVVAMVLDAEDGYSVRPEVTVDIIVQAMEELRALGRTERWQNNITRWQNMVKECDQYDRDAEGWTSHMHWAILQGNVYVGHAAL